MQRGRPATLCLPSLDHRLIKPRRDTSRRVGSRVPCRSFQYRAFAQPEHVPRFHQPPWHTDRVLAISQTNHKRDMAYTLTMLQSPIDAVRLLSTGRAIGRPRLHGHHEASPLKRLLTRGRKR